MFYSEDIEYVVGGINLIEDTIISYSEREFSPMISDERLPFIGTVLKRFYLPDDSIK
jgi:hypothetical protein